MSDAQNQEAPPAWVNEFKAQVGGALQTLNKQQHALAQHIQANQARPAAAAPIQVNQNDLRGQILNTMVNEPDRYSAEVIGTAVQKATANAQAILAEERKRMQDERDSEFFWTGFYQHHGDLAAVQNEVNAAYNATDPSMPPSVRADTAAEFVRKKLAAASSYAADAERYRLQQQRMAAGAPGNGLRTPGSRPDDEVVDSEEATKRWLDEQRKSKAKKQWSNINDAAYQQNAQKRQNMHAA